MIFKDLGFEPQLQEGLDMMGFEKPTPIQEQAIPAILNNKDMIIITLIMIVVIMIKIMIKILIMMIR